MGHQPIRIVLHLSDGAEETPLRPRRFARGRHTWRRGAPHLRLTLEPITLQKRCNLPVTRDPVVVAKLSHGPEVGGVLYGGEHATSHVVFPVVAMPSHGSVAVSVNMRALNNNLFVEGTHVDTNSNAIMGRHYANGTTCDVACSPTYSKPPTSGPRLSLATTNGSGVTGKLHRFRNVIGSSDLECGATRRHVRRPRANGRDMRGVSSAPSLNWRTKRMSQSSKGRR